MEISVENCNLSNPKYPITVRDKGWVYGVWYCGSSFTKHPFYGMYPLTFMKRALALFPDAKDILHCPSGTVKGPGVTVDMIRDEVRCPQIIARAEHLPFEDNSFDLILSDPPYTPPDAKKYGTPKFPLRKAMDEFNRVLRPGGYLGLLHLYYPYYDKKRWELNGLITVITGVNRKARVFSLARKVPANSQLTVSSR